MKIIKYTKIKLNKYKLLLDNQEEIILYDDIILKYDLLLTKTIKNLEVILNDNNSLEGYYMLLKKISRRMMSIKEAKDYLYKKEIYNKNTIDRLINEGYLNDDNYLIHYINDQVNLKIVGPEKIVLDLISLNIEENKAREYLNTIDYSIWQNKINKYLDKKIKSNTKYSNNLLKQKLITDLINKGFNKNQILEELEKFEFSSDKDFLMHDYEKIMNTTKRKYAGKELSIKVRQKLIAKGYNINEINEVINEYTKNY